MSDEAKIQQLARWAWDEARSIDMGHLGGHDRVLYPGSLGRRKALAKRVELESFEGMIRPGFLLGDERSALMARARDGSVTHRLARRANALVLLDDGLSCEQVARVLLLDDDTIRRWHGAFAEGGRKALMRF